MTQHSIDAIKRFADDLDNENRSLEVRSKRSSEKCGDESEISPDNSPPCAAGPQYPSVFRDSTGILLIDESGLERCARKWSEYSSRRWTMECHKAAVALNRRMKSGDVRKSNYRFSMAAKRS